MGAHGAEKDAGARLLKAANLPQISLRMFRALKGAKTSWQRKYRFDEPGNWCLTT